MTAEAPLGAVVLGARRAMRADLVPGETRQARADRLRCHIAAIRVAHERAAIAGPS